MKESFVSHSVMAKIFGNVQIKRTCSVTAKIYTNKLKSELN